MAIVIRHCREAEELVTTFTLKEVVGGLGSQECHTEDDPVAESFPEQAKRSTGAEGASE